MTQLAWWCCLLCAECLPQAAWLRTPTAQGSAWGGGRDSRQKQRYSVGWSAPVFHPKFEFSQFDRNSTQGEKQQWIHFCWYMDFFFYWIFTILFLHCMMWKTFMWAYFKIFIQSKPGWNLLTTVDRVKPLPHTPMYPGAVPQACPAHTEFLHVGQRAPFLLTSTHTALTICLPRMSHAWPSCHVSTHRFPYFQPSG